MSAGKLVSQLGVLLEAPCSRRQSPLLQVFHAWGKCSLNHRINCFITCTYEFDFKFFVCSIRITNVVVRQHLSEFKSSSLLISGMATCGWFPKFLQ